MDDKAQIFQEYRSELTNIAYGMLGSLSHARDIVQDAFIRWDGVDLEEINKPASYLKSIVTRLCIDHFRSARQQREEYIGPWLPEPIAGDDSVSPDHDIELRQELSIALLFLMEHLSADQRAIYLLHDVFDYTFDEISELVGKNPSACRKSAQRARKYIRENNAPQKTTPKEAQKIIRHFLEALQQRDIKKLQSVLTDDIIIYSDGGGKVKAARKPIISLDKVSRFLMGISEDKNGTVQETKVNGETGFKAYIDGELHSIWSFEFTNGQIKSIFAIVNPSKLSAAR